MNERERKELAGLVADCKPCRGRIQTWLESHKAKAKAKAPKKAGELTARGLVRLLGSLPKAPGNLVVFRAGKPKGGYVEGTNGEAWARFNLPVHGKGSAIVDGRAVSRWLATRNSSPITVTVEDTPAEGTRPLPNDGRGYKPGDKPLNGLTVDAGGVKVGFLKALGTQLPKTPKGKARDMGVIAADALAEALKSVAFSASDKEMRYAMNGIAFDGDKLAATNGRSLAFARVVGLEGFGEKDPTPIFPLYHLRSLIAILRRNGEEKIKVRQVVCKAGHNGKETREFLAFAGPRAGFTVREVEGRFPSWREVVPKTKAAAALELDARELAEGLLSLAALTPEDSEDRAIKMAVDGADVTLTHSNGRQETVEVKGKVKGRAGTSAAWINPQFMADALKTVKGEVGLELRGSEDVVVLKSGAWQYILMPISPRKTDSRTVECT